MSKRGKPVGQRGCKATGPTVGAGVVSILMLNAMVHTSTGTARDVEEESDVVTRLRVALATEHELAHALVDNGAQVADAFTAADETARTVLEEAEATFAGDSSNQDGVTLIRRQWKQSFRFSPSG